MVTQNVVITVLPVALKVPVKDTNANQSWIQLGKTTQVYIQLLDNTNTRRSTERRRNEFRSSPIHERSFMQGTESEGYSCLFLYYSLVHTVTLSVHSTGVQLVLWRRSGTNPQPTILTTNYDSAEVETRGEGDELQELKIERNHQRLDVNKKRKVRTRIEERSNNTDSSSREHVDPPAYV